MEDEDLVPVMGCLDCGTPEKAQVVHDKLKPVFPSAAIVEEVKVFFTEMWPPAEAHQLGAMLIEYWQEEGDPHHV